MPLLNLGTKFYTALINSFEGSMEGYLSNDRFNKLSPEQQTQEINRITQLHRTFAEIMLQDSDQRDLLSLVFLAGLSTTVKKIEPHQPTTEQTQTNPPNNDTNKAETNTPNSLQLTITLTPLTKKMLTRLVESGQEPNPEEAINTAIQQYYTLACIELADDLLFYDVIMAMTSALDKIFDTNKKERIIAELGTREDAAKRSALKAANLIHLVEGSWETVNRFILQRKMANDKRQIITEITNNPKTDTETDESTKTTPPTEPTADPAAKETHKIDIQ